jgi:FkbM family methyltransferase
MEPHLGAAIVGHISRRLPFRRWQASFWLGKLLVPRKPFVGRFQGGLIEVHPGEVASYASFFVGFYEREVSIWCQELIRRDPPDLLVDVGANFGYYPLLFGLRTRGRTRSIAFEPDPSTFHWLKRNVALNPGLGVTTVASAVGNRDDTAIAFATAQKGHSLWAQVARDGAAGEHIAETVDVPVTALDTYLDRHGIDRVALTLIDVEGFEGEVLEGMTRGLREHRYRRVVVEFHPWAFDSTDAIERIARHVVDAGYRGYRFRHFEPPDPDKDRSYYRLRYDDSILGPMTFDHMTTWEHFLFEAGDENAPGHSAPGRG